MLMALGQFVFATDTLTFNQIQRQRTWNYASNAVAQGREQLQYIGAGNDNITLPCLIYESHGFGKRQAIDDLVWMANTGGGFVLIDGTGYLYGVYVIESLDETRSVLTFDGVPRKIDATLKLTRVDEDRIANKDRP